MSISGNYNTSQFEINIVTSILKQNGIGFQSVKKHSLADDADVLVTLSNGKEFTIEVKEESFDRFKRYGDLGIDYISSCVFKKNNYASTWKGAPKSPSRHDAFLQAIDVDSSYFKWGKVFYSKADLWLFYVETVSGGKYWIYDGKEMTSKSFLKYLRDNCEFTVNNKPPTQGSYYDKHHSAVFFIKPDNEVLSKYKIDLNRYIKDL